MSCESCQSQFFPYLYDLLEPVERQELEAHVHDCTHCQLELECARVRRAQLGIAIKSSFPDITFKSPSRGTGRARPAAAPRRPRRPVLLSGWGLAAAVLLAVLSAGTVAGWSLYIYQTGEVEQAAQQRLEAQEQLQRVRLEMEAKKTVADKEVLAVQDQIDRLMKEWDRDQRKARVDAKQKGVYFEIKGPKAVQPGAPNRYEVEVKPTDPAQPPRVTRLSAQVVNEKTKAVLFDRQLVALGKNQLILPQDLPVKPGDELSLVLSADADNGPAQIREHLTLSFPEYVTHLSTDRPMYRPGEVVHFRSLTLDRFSLQPASEELNLRYRIAGPNNPRLWQTEVSTRLVTGKDKKPLLGPDGQPLHGLGCGEYALSKDLPGGVYTLVVSEVNERFAEERRTFVIHRWQPPRFNKEAEFHRTSYGPGDHAILKGKVNPVGEPAGAGAVGGGGAPNVGFGPPNFPGGPPGVNTNGIVVTASGSIDGIPLNLGQANADLDGSFSFEFDLPGQMTQGIGSITLTFQDGGTFETLVRPIPVVLRDIAIKLYPEGGDLIAGVPNRVYFQAYTGTNKPADVHGRLFVRERTGVDKNGKEIFSKDAAEVARFQTLTDDKEPGINQGLGSFTFTPEAGKRYEIKLDAPVGIAKAYPVLPPADPSYKLKADGVALHLPAGVVTGNIPVVVTSAGKDRELLVGAYCRGKLLDSTPLLAPAGKKTELVLHPAVNVGGVYRVTVFEKQSAAGEVRYQPVAERLLFRKQTAALQVAVRPDQKVYAPRDRVTLDLEATNEKKETVPAVAMVAVVDASVFTLVNDRTARRMPTHFLLTTEVRQPEDLENADALLGDHPKAAQALDLLLGAQGWRRFAEQDPQKFPPRKGIARHPGFLAAQQPVVKVGQSEQHLRDQLDQKFVTEFVTLQEKLAEKERAQAVSAQEAQVQSLQNNVNMTENILREQESRRRDLSGFFLQAALGTGFALVVFFAFMLTSVSLYRLAEGKSGYIGLTVGLGLLLMLFMAGVFGTFILMGSDLHFERIGGRFGGARTMAPMPPMAQAQIQAAEDMAVAPVPGGIAPELRNEANLLPPEPEPPAPNVALPVGAEKVAAVPGNGEVGAPGLPMFNPMFLNGDPDRRDRQIGKFQDILQRKLGRKVTVPPPVNPSVVREYAHQHKGAPGLVRRDFTETLCWQPALVLKDGQGKVEFDLSDHVAGFQVLVVSHSLDGRLGADTFVITSRLPYQLEPKVPAEIAATDQLDLPVSLTNNTADRVTVKLSTPLVKGVRLLDDLPGPLQLNPGQSRRQVFRYRPTIGEGKAQVQFLGQFDRGTDAVERTFEIVPDGFPAGGSYSGILNGAAPVTHEIVMPGEANDWVRGTLTLQLQAYPSVLADLQRGLDAMLREPHGCFEQSSSSNYPNVLILNYLQDSKQVNPIVEKRARGLLDSGYSKLVSFECIAPEAPATKRGYEWFGQTAPPHEALTAYGLMQFHDMARVYSVDRAMMERTQKYLLDQRDGSGGFKRNARALDSFGRAPQDITNAYIVWALTETGVKDELEAELDALYEQSRTSKDPYFLALAGLGQLNSGRTDAALEILRRLGGSQKETGEVTGARTSITASAGRDLLVETTALSALAWLRAARPADFHANTQKAGKWLMQQRGGAGNFGSTQATILALKALIAFAADGQKAIQTADLVLERLENEPVMIGSARLSPGMTEPITIQLKEKTGDAQPPNAVAPGKNALRVRLTGGNTQLPYTLSWTYRAIKPASADAPPLHLTATLGVREAQEGKSVKLRASVENKSGKDQGMAVAILGLPAGLSLPADFAQLKELTRLRDNGKKPGVISAWELKNRELVLYWRDLQAGAKVDVELDLVCQLPGIYSGPASRAYLYYNADHKHWIEPLRLTINAVP